MSMKPKAKLTRPTGDRILWAWTVGSTTDEEAPYEYTASLYHQRWTEDGTQAAIPVYTNATIRSYYPLAEGTYPVMRRMGSWEVIGPFRTPLQVGDGDSGGDVNQAYLVEGGHIVPLGRALRVANVGTAISPKYRPVLDVNQLYVGKFSGETMLASAPLYDFIDGIGSSGETMALRLSSVTDGTDVGPMQLVYDDPNFYSDDPPP